MMLAPYVARHAENSLAENREAMPLLNLAVEHEWRVMHQRAAVQAPKHAATLRRRMSKSLRALSLMLRERPLFAHCGVVLIDASDVAFNGKPLTCGHAQHIDFIVNGHVHLRLGWRCECEHICTARAPQHDFTGAPELWLEGTVSPQAHSLKVQTESTVGCAPHAIYARLATALQFGVSNGLTKKSPSIHSR